MHTRPTWDAAKLERRGSCKDAGTLLTLALSSLWRRGDPRLRPADTPEDALEKPQALACGCAAAASLRTSKFGATGAPPLVSLASDSISAIFSVM